MMADPSDRFDPTEVDEPTQPYTRKEIDRLRRGVDDIEGEWFEVEGHRIRVSLSALAHIGFSGGSPRMLSSAKSSCVSGEIGASDVLVERWLDPRSRGRRRGLGVIGCTLALVVVVVLRTSWSTSTAQDEPLEARAGVPAELTPTPEPAPTPAQGPATAAPVLELPPEPAPKPTP
jgi:hypothetical protein